ncbi:unnamed protein product, partial [marine sediment metagenome]
LYVILDNSLIFFCKLGEAVFIIKKINYSSKRV